MLLLAQIYWNPDPILVEIGPLSVHWYGALFALGFVAGYYLVRDIFRRENRPERDLEVLLIYVFIGTVIGARLGHVIFYDPIYYFSQPLRILRVWEGGLASHGGGVGVLIAIALYARSRPDQPYLWLLDRVAIPTALAGSFIRVGNFFNAEIIGRPTDAPWAVVFAPVDLLPRHPAQLYEAVAYLAIFTGLYAWYRWREGRIPNGLIVAAFLISVFTARFVIEFVKVRQEAFDLGIGLSMGQLLSIPMIIAGLVLWNQSSRRSIDHNNQLA